MQTHMHTNTGTHTHTLSCALTCALFCSHTYRYTHTTTHIYCMSMYLHTLWKDAGQIRLELYLLWRRKFISTASQLQVHSYETVITLANDLTQTNTPSQRECTHNKKTFHIAAEKKKKQSMVLLKVVTAYGEKLCIDSKCETYPVCEHIERNDISLNAFPQCILTLSFSTHTHTHTPTVQDNYSH